MKEFADWLAATLPSLLIQRNESWVIPTIQSLHIIGVGIVLTCVLMITLRVLGIAGDDRTLLQTLQRFGPWLTGVLFLLLGTGLVLILAEPERELLAFSFWLKMILVACGAGLTVLFQRSVRRHEQAWETVLVRQVRVRVLVAAAFLIWIAIIFLGRFIAYDHIWGSLSGSTKA
jgi:hypothetical protein